MQYRARRFQRREPAVHERRPVLLVTWNGCMVPEPAGLKPDIMAVPESHAVYDFLKELNQTATVFYIGSNVQNWPLEAQRAIADGHEICAHTWIHPYMTAVDSEGTFAELYYAATRSYRIRTITGVTPSAGAHPTYETFDYNGPSVQVAVDQNYENLTARAKNGTFAAAGMIMLTHELTNLTMEAAVAY
ncbi:carbohydrate esterase family 4 protein [Athelia psychrophila]|uniref:chitin deacetylase n=1 Tax=Athelia psychrophila TaxID=1759441 RepID=A0A167TZP8_9AGAM|nr:carbohydrate esterase family 4 protein [Fibularhizoctonia sp. CBS 109695]